MADSRTVEKTIKSTIILVKTCTDGFSESLIMNPKPDFHNLKWRIQDGGRKNEKSTIILVKICTPGFFRSRMMNP